MSEIKGQLLGMMLVLLVFALIGGVLYSSFQRSAEEISSALVFGSASHSSKGSEASSSSEDIAHMLITPFPEN